MTKDEEIKNLKEQLSIGNCIMHNMIVANQAAYIEHVAGNSDKAMEWIENGLFGPGHIPENEDKKSAQEWYNQNVVEIFGNTTQ